MFYTEVHKERFGSMSRDEYPLLERLPVRIWAELKVKVSQGNSKGRKGAGRTDDSGWHEHISSVRIS